MSLPRRLLLAIWLTSCSASVTPAKTAPAPLPLRPRVRSVAVGPMVGCAIRRGELYCWGFRWYAPAPGDPPWSDGPIHPGTGGVAPYRVQAGGPVSAVSIARSDSAPHGVMLLEDGEVRGWGMARFGELGDGTTNGSLIRTSPSRTRLPSRATAIATLGGRSCALIEGGTVACWGHLLPDPARSRGLLPTVVRTSDGALTNVVRLEVGAAIDGGGRLWIFDDALVGVEGLVGDTARTVSDLPPVVDVATTGTGVCALTDKGRVLCWGGVPPTYQTGIDYERLAAEVWERPTALSLPRIRALACGIDGLCVFASEDGRVFTWEQGSDGPREQPQLSGRPESIAVGRGVCLAEGAEVRCWREGLEGIADSDADDGAVHRVPVP